MPPFEKNTLFYGDNLPILREYFPDECVDLIYLDPPFNSNRSYNILFKDETGEESEAQLTAFDDSWHWGPTAEETFHELITESPPRVGEMIGALRNFIGTNQMLAYLVMMTARLVELHRVLKPTGSLYLHCDPTASHYLKVILDTIFGPENFRNEIIWKRQSAHSDATTKFPDVADVILFYSKSTKTIFTPQFGDYDPDYVEKFYRHDDGDGRGPYSLADMASPNPRPNLMYEWQGFPYPAKGWRYSLETMQNLHDEARVWYPRAKNGDYDFTRRPRLKRYLREQRGSIFTNIWTDIQPLHDVSNERLGYPTQKPLELLERIISASSQPGDLVLDPFCGCGTAVVAAESSGRRWAGIDITHLSIALMRYRIKDAYPDADFRIIGEPEDLAAAEQLAGDDRYQFQWWALSLIQAKPLGGDQGSRKGKKGSDKGVDGAINFVDGSGQARKIIVQVKSGKVGSRDIRDLKGTVDREGAAIGLFITLEPPTRDMDKEAAEAGYYESKLWQRKYPRIQILTIEQLLDDRLPDIPPTHGTFKKAERPKGKAPKQSGFDL